jgi:hypothetical protein
MGADTSPPQWLPDPTIRFTDGFRLALPRGQLTGLPQFVGRFRLDR